MQQFHKLSNLIKSKNITHNGIEYIYELKSFEGGEVASFGIVLYEICVRLIKNSISSFYRTGGLFTDFEKAIRFFDFLCDNLATPQNIPYIIEDCFSF